MAREASNRCSVQCFHPSARSILRAFQPQGHCTIDLARRDFGDAGFDVALEAEEIEFHLRRTLP